MKVILMIMLILASISCTIEAEIPEIEIPPIENSMTITIDPADIPFPVLSEGESEENRGQSNPPCTFQLMPEYPEGYISWCGVNCCEWMFPDTNGYCSEKWCLSLSDTCGWSLDSWDCNSY
jgi:hypothetical protein